MKRILIYGYGNPGRQDDGLGISLVEQLELWHADRPLPYIDFDTNYQLNIEDALTISEYDMVVFADASVEDISTFTITRVEASPKTEFTMHAMSPEFILHLCQHLYGKFPEVYLVHIKGIEFELQEGLTPQAAENLRATTEFLIETLNGSTSPNGFINLPGALLNQHKNQSQT